MHILLTNWLPLGDCWYKYIEFDFTARRRNDKIVAFISISDEKEGFYDVFIWPNSINVSEEDVEWPIDMAESKNQKCLIIKGNSNIETAFLKGNVRLTELGFSIKDITK